MLGIKKVLEIKLFFISSASFSWKNGTSSIQRHLVPPQPGRKRKSCGGTDEVSPAAKNADSQNKKNQEEGAVKYSASVQIRIVVF